MPASSLQPPPGNRTGQRPGTTYLALAAVLALPATVLLVLVATAWGPLMSLDRTVAEDLHRSATTHPGWTGTNRVLTDWFWDPWTMRALVALAAGLLLWRGERMTALWVIAVSLTGTAVQQGLKLAVGRARPSWPDPVGSAQFSSFPSGHAMTAAVTFSVLLWLLYRQGVRGGRAGIAVTVAAVSVAGVGFTRLYLGVHWLTDVLAGWLLGAALVAVSVAGYIRWDAAAARRPPSGER